MARCEDFPCCGQELGCCPDYSESGKQLNMVCTCGAKVSIDSQFSICDGCMNRDDDEADKLECGGNAGFVKDNEEFYPGEDDYYDDDPFSGLSF